MRPRGPGRGGANDRGRIPQGLSLAIHPLRLPAPAFRKGALEPDHRGPGQAHPVGACHAAIILTQLITSLITGDLPCPHERRLPNPPLSTVSTSTTCLR